MTCREKLAMENPKCVDPKYTGGCLDCPSDYGYLDNPPEDECGVGYCCECWDREIPEDKSISISGKEAAEHAIKGLTAGVNDTIPEIVEATERMVKEATEKANEFLGIKDSGDRTRFESGAVRDMHTGKGDMVSLPPAAILRLSKHYENGALKYGRWNYTKGIPVSSFLDSALRHLFKYLDGWDDEDHLSAAAFNVLGAMEMEATHKEMIDLPNREGKNCFGYPRE